MGSGRTRLSAVIRPSMRQSIEPRSNHAKSTARRRFASTRIRRALLDGASRWAYRPSAVRRAGASAGVGPLIEHRGAPAPASPASSNRVKRKQEAQQPAKPFPTRPELARNQHKERLLRQSYRWHDAFSGVRIKITIHGRHCVRIPTNPKRPRCHGVMRVTIVPVILNASSGDSFSFN